MNEIRRFTEISVLVCCLIALYASPVSRELTVVIPVNPINTGAKLSKREVGPTQINVKGTTKLSKQIKTFRVTAYTGIDRGESGDDITASGVKAIPYKTVAASPDLPFGTVLVDMKTGKRYIVEDRGGAINGDSLDLYVGHNNVKTALQFGVQYLTLEIEK